LVVDLRGVGGSVEMVAIIPTTASAASAIGAGASNTSRKEAYMLLRGRDSTTEGGEWLSSHQRSCFEHPQEANGAAREEELINT
jgi:hypothetical protein